MQAVSPDLDAQVVTQETPQLQGQRQTRQTGKGQMYHSVNGQAVKAAECEEEAKVQSASHTRSEEDALEAPAASYIF